MADKSVDILINTTANTAGVTQTQAALAKLNVSMEGLNEATQKQLGITPPKIKVNTEGLSDATRNLLNLNAAEMDAAKGADYINPAFANAEKGIGAASAGAAKMGTNFRLLSLAARDAGAQIPGLSILLRGLFNPATIGLVAGMEAIELYFSHINKVLQKQLDWTLELQKTNDQLHEITASGKTAAQMFVAINQTLAEGQFKLQGYARDVDDLQEYWKKLETAVTDESATEKEAHEDSGAAIEQKIKLLEKMGVLTKENAEALMREQKFEEEKKKAQDDIAAKNAQYTEKQKERAALGTQLQNLGSRPDAVAKKEADESALQKNQKVITDMPAVIADLKGKLEIANSRLDITKEHELMGMIDSNQRILDKARTENPGLSTAVAQDTDRLAAMDKLTDAIRSLGKDLDNLNLSIIDTKKKSDAHLAAMSQGLATDVFGEGATDLLKKGIGTASRVNAFNAGKGGQVNSSDVNEMVRIAEAATGHIQTTQTAANALTEASKHVDIFMGDVGNLVDVMERIADALPPNLTHRVEAIESRLARAHY